MWQSLLREGCDWSREAEEVGFSVSQDTDSTLRPNFYNPFGPFVPLSTHSGQKYSVDSQNCVVLREADP